MTKTELLEIISNGENSGVEFKRDVLQNYDLAKELVAFSNLRGGMVLLGVFAFFSTLGEIGALPPVVAVWAPSLVFAALSLYLFLGVRT